MTVKQIASAAAVLLAADGIAEILDRADPNTDDSDVKALAACVNTAVTELRSSGFADTAVESMSAENGLIAADKFSHRPTIIRSVAQFGRPVRFTFDSRGVTVGSDGVFEVAYVADSGELSLDDEVVLGGGADCTVAAYLTARNYCIVTGRADEARVWDELYSDGCARLRMTRRARIRPRLWG